MFVFCSSPTCQPVDCLPCTTTSQLHDVVVTTLPPPTYHTQCCVRSCRKSAPITATHVLASIAGHYVMADSVQSKKLGELYVCALHMVGQKAVKADGQLHKQTVAYACSTNQCQETVVYKYVLYFMCETLNKITFSATNPKTRAKCTKCHKITRRIYHAHRQ